MKKFVMPALTILLILSVPLSLQGQNTTGRKKPAEMEIPSGNFTVLTPAFLEDYVRQRLSPLEKGNENVKFETVSRKSSEIPTLFQKGEGIMAFAVNPFGEKRPDKEIEVLKTPPGEKILSMIIGRTGILMATHASNPLKGLTISQADAIFSSTRSCGYPFAIIRWGELGLSAPWANKPVHIAGLTGEGFFYRLFRQTVLCGGTVKESLLEEKDAEDVLSRISKDKNAIGFCPFGRIPVNVKAIPISSRAGAAYFPPTDKNILSGKYPISRTVYMFVRIPPDTSLPRWQKIFIKETLSEKGQKLLSDYGIVPACPEGGQKTLSRYLGKRRKRDKRG